MPNLTVLNSQDADFKDKLAQLLAFETVTDASLIQTVDDIIAQVRADGDAAVLTLTQKFDKHPATTIDELFISSEQLKSAFDQLDNEVKEALELSAKRIFDFHQHQKEDGFRFVDGLGNTLGQKLRHLIVWVSMCQVVWRVILLACL